jgi:calcium/calmodulin-dependent protein kinase (CaM kinase) II
VSDIVNELLEINQRLLDAIAAGDWAVYTELCDESLTAFEPEAKGHLVTGLEFHRIYFDLPRPVAPPTSTMQSPQVRLLGDDVAVVTYVRLVQRVIASGEGYGASASTPSRVETLATEETRVWQRQDDRWRHVHFHRSAVR